MTAGPGDELVDHLDSAGRVIGTVTRAHMRRERLPHRCVYVLVFNSRGELFVHRRTATKDVFPSCWDVAVGGVLAAGESFADGARREGREELGVDLDPVELFPFHYADGHTVAFGHVFRACHNGPFCLQPDEVECGEFVPTAELPRRMACERFCPDGRLVWAEFCRRQKSGEKSENPL